MFLADPRFQNLLHLAEKFYDNGDPGHDMAHILRVVGTCKRIGLELGADLSTLLPAAILHDVVNVPKNHPDRLKASALAAEKGRTILKNNGYSEQEIERILTVIVEHSYSLGKKPSSLESAIMQDADRLDALGAVGVMRVISCGVQMGAKYYDLNEPIAATRALDDKKYSIDHFFVKLSKLAAGMNTEPARQEAERRTQFMRQFLSQLVGEINFESETKLGAAPTSIGL